MLHMHTWQAAGADKALVPLDLVSFLGALKTSGNRFHRHFRIFWLPCAGGTVPQRGSKGGSFAHS